MKGKRFLFRLSVVCLALTFTIGMAYGISEAAPKKIVWTFNQQALGKWCDNKFFGEVVPKRLAEATGGRLELHVPINLLPIMEVLHGVRDGIVQGAVAGTPYYSGEWPIGSFHAIPGVLRENDEYPAVAEAIAWDYLDKSLQKKYGIRLKGINHWAGITLYANRPIRTLSEFKGVKIRGMGYYDSLAFEKVGAAGIMVPWDEAFLAVQRGVVDGLVTGLVAYDSMGFWEYAKYINMWPVHGASCAAMIIVNEKAWNALPEDLKPIVAKVLREAGQENCKCNSSLVAASLESLKKRGCEVIKPSEEEFQKSLVMMEPVRQKWLEQCDKAGTPEAREMLEKIEAYLAGYRAGKKAQ